MKTIIAPLLLLSSSVLLFMATHTFDDENCLPYEGPVNAFCIANCEVTLKEGMASLSVQEFAITNPIDHSCDLFEVRPSAFTFKDIGTKKVELYQKGATEPLCSAWVSIQN